MSTPVSGSRIRKDLGRFLPAHRLVVSDPQRSVTVRPESVPEVCSVIQYAQAEGVPVFPLPEHGRVPQLEGWCLVVSLSGLKSVLEYSPDSALVTVQSGATLEAFGDWLHEKHLTLATGPETEGPIALWEYLASPEVGRFGPKYGAKWDQVMNLTAVLPNGRIYRNTSAPGRSVGPDFSKLILMGRGRFGLPLELTLRVHTKPPRRETLVFGMPTLAEAMEQAWPLVEETSPEYLEVGCQRTQGATKVWLSTELWGEGNRLSVRKEKVRKRLGPGAFAMEATQIQPASTLHRTTDHGNLARDAVLEGLADLLQQIKGDVDIRVRGFLDSHVCIIVRHQGESVTRCSERSSMHSSQDGEKMLRGIALELDPSGVFAHVPSLWE